MVNPMTMHWCKLYKGTKAEMALEPAVARLGVPYRTQFPLFLYGGRYFPDFLLPTMLLVIEVDDDSHSEPKKMAEDAERSAELKRRWNWDVIRIPNEEAISDPRGALKRALAQLPRPMRQVPLASGLPAAPGPAKKSKRPAPRSGSPGRKRFGA